jgi:hypothetical protein
MSMNFNGQLQKFSFPDFHGSPLSYKARLDAQLSEVAINYPHSQLRTNTMTSFNSNINTDICDRLCKKYGNELVDGIRSEVLARVDNLPADVNLTANQILGNDLWKKTDPDYHKVYGSVLAGLVRARLVPLRFVKKNGANHLLYLVIKNHLLKIA